MTLSQPTTATPKAGVVPEAAAPSGRGRAIALAALAVALLFAGTYAFAWSRAAALSNTYLHDADASYQAGDYLTALVGGQKFDLSTNSYRDVGGYLPVQRIWASPFAWPQPGGLDHDRQRIDDIISHKLTVDQALQFVQENTGKSNPYLGIIYLRLGELYQEKGDVKDARDVFQSVPQLFKDQPDLIKRAQDRMKQLPAQ